MDKTLRYHVSVWKMAIKRHKALWLLLLIYFLDAGGYLPYINSSIVTLVQAALLTWGMIGVVADEYRIELLIIAHDRLGGMYDKLREEYNKLKKGKQQKGQKPRQAMPPMSMWQPYWQPYQPQQVYHNGQDDPEPPPWVYDEEVS